MYRHVVSITALGGDACWLLVQQALGMRDASARSDFLSERVALLVFGELSLPERLCVTAAVRQMGGTTIYEGERRGQWRDEVRHFQQHLVPVFGYYIDCLYTYGLPVDTWDMTLAETQFPVINAGSADAHPAHALADIACMLRQSRTLDGLTLGWLGCANGTLNSLLAATLFFPFSLRVALPSCDDTKKRAELAKERGYRAEFVETPEEAVAGADYVLAGCRAGICGENVRQWRVTPELMRLAAPSAHLLLSARPVSAVPVAVDVLCSRASLLVRQAEYRLRVHKRILHWVFEASGHAQRS